MVSVTALMDNRTSDDRRFIAEHGLAFFVEYHGLRLLFDCGQGPNTWKNAGALGIDLSNPDGVILSHSHYDHAAGYRSLREKGLGGAVLYTGPRFFEPKYSFDGLRYLDRSCGFDRDFLQEHGVVHRVVNGVQEVFAGVWLVSGFPKVFDFEEIPARFVRRTEPGFAADDFCDEICMALEVEGGLAVVVGCAHPGIVNMMSQVSKMLKKPVKAVFGGIHLTEAEEPRIAETVDCLEKMGLEILGFCHCTGEAAEAAVNARPGLRGCHLASGDRMELI